MKCSTALVTNVAFEDWNAFLRDARFSMAFLDGLESYQGKRWKNLPTATARESAITIG
jgi:hypothetical protein